ncbi:MAG: hypothetical protein HFE86_07930 [Clostridiales bacterium]|nr:hypothetical protein [Clostridiales bacterium]
MAGITEAVMLICFGISWPISAYKSWKARQTGGKSLLFLVLIDLGYIVGLIGKILFRPDYVIVVYCINLFFVTADLLLYFRNRRLEKAAAREGAEEAGPCEEKLQKA